MKTVQISTAIAAPIAVVWRVLTETLPREPAPFGILRFTGDLKKGGRIRIWSEVDPKRPFTLRVPIFDPPRAMVWRGGMPFGLFSGTRTFALSGDARGTTFSMEEVFTGPLSGMIVKAMRDLRPSFKKFADTLKERAEADG